MLQRTSGFLPLFLLGTILYLMLGTQGAGGLLVDQYFSTDNVEHIVL
jgi:hypothetical protein